MYIQKVINRKTFWVWVRSQIFLFSSLTFKSPKKELLLKSFSAYYFLKVRYIYIIFQRQKVKKKSQNSRNQGCSYLFCLMIKGSGPLNNGFGSGRPKKIRIRRIRIRNTDPNYQFFRPIKG
jgi:hypothetical protein